YRLAEHAIAVGELHLLPAPQLFAQPLVAAGLRGLSLQRAALLLNLEDNVVDPREILLRRLQLQFRGAAAALVFRHARRFLDQLTAIRGTRAEDLPDLSLLDDGVGAHAETGIHQQVLHVLEPHDLAVNQVLALPGAIQPPRDLDIAHDQRRFVEERNALSRAEQLARGRCDHGFSAGQRSRRLPRRKRVVLRPHLAAAGHARRDPSQPNPDFSRGGCLARIASCEDHVLHVLAAQRLCALLAEDPRDRIDHVALPAAVRADDGGDAVVERKFGSIREALEAGNLETLEAHIRNDPWRVFRPGIARRVQPASAKATAVRRSATREGGRPALQNKKAAAGHADKARPGSGWGRFGEPAWARARDTGFLRNDDRQQPLVPTAHTLHKAGWPLGPGERRSV